METPATREEIRQLISHIRPWLSLLDSTTYNDFDTPHTIQVLSDMQGAMSRDWDALMECLNRLQETVK